MAGFAVSRTAQMLHELVGTLESDIKEYRDKAGDSSLTFTPDDAALRQWIKIERSSFPHFAARLERSGNTSQLLWQTTTKASTSAEVMRASSAIDIICKGQDACFYRIKGKDWAAKEAVSEYLLSPLIDLL